MAILFSDFVAMCNQVSDQINASSQVMDDLNAKLTQAVADRDAALRQVVDLQTQTTQLTQQLTDANGQITSLNIANANLTSNNAALATQLQTVNANLQQANSTIAGLQAQITDLTNQLAAAKKTIATLQAQVAAALPTISLASLTAHNVSSAINYTKANFPTLFAGNTNHDGTVSTVNSSLMDDSQNAASPMNVSKLSVRTLIPAGSKTRLAMHAQLWWGLGSHPDVGFSDLDPLQMQNIVNDVKENGFDVFIPDWYHPTKASVLNDAGVDLLASCCQKAGMNFMVMIDQQYFSNGGYTAATYQAGIIAGINHLADRYFSHPAYEHYVYNGVSRPLILLWDVANVGGANIDWNAVRAAVHGNPLIIQYQASGFSVVQSDGALSWLSTGADTTTVPSGTNYLTGNFFPACTAHQDKICISSVWKGFNGTLTKNTSWSLGKFLDQRNGQTWLDCWKVNSDYIAAGHRLDYIACITLDDLQEGSGVQTGIRNDIAFTSTAITGNFLSWTTQGNENTVARYDIYFSLDGVNTTKVASVTTNIKQLDLTTFNIPAGATVYVYALGQPRIQNHLSQGVTY